MRVEKVSRRAKTVLCKGRSVGLKGFPAGIFTVTAKSNFESRPLTEAALRGIRSFWIYELQEGTARQTLGAGRKLWEVHFLLDIKKLSVPEGQGRTSSGFVVAEFLRNPMKFPPLGLSFSWEVRLCKAYVKKQRVTNLNQNNNGHPTCSG